jgi:hypothetical protein
MRKVKIFAASVGQKFGETAENYGDNLMADLLRELFSCEPVYVKESEAELLGIGSLLDIYYKQHHKDKLGFLRKRPWRTLHVWGAGFISSTTKALWPQSLVFHAVRGELTKARVAPESFVALGDPALLLPLIWPKKVTPTAEVTIIPHFITYQNFVAQYGAGLPKHWRILNLLGDPKAITDGISSSDYIVSSSLHGLILADAYDIPSRWMEPHGELKGDGFKFIDYFSCRGAPIAGPIDFETFLSDFKNGVRDGAASVPSPERISALLQSFPFR